MEEDTRAGMQNLSIQEQRDAQDSKPTVILVIGAAFGDPSAALPATAVRAAAAHLLLCALMPRLTACAGMAGSGKTTFMQRLNAHLHEKQQPGYIINLDPAVSSLGTWQGCEQAVGRLAVLCPRMARNLRVSLCRLCACSCGRTVTWLAQWVGVG
jgi:hypothetical protein